MPRTPARIQRRRQKGWKMPEGAVYVGRPTKWGNPYIVGGNKRNIFAPVPDNHAMAVEWFSRTMARLLEIDERVILPLRGKDLACWCRLCERHKDGLPLGEKCDDCQPCHADVLLDLANR